jgi:prephenate dehydrogenase
MGTSFALAVKKRLPATRLVGIDVDVSTLGKAQALGHFDHLGSDIRDGSAADLVLVAVPISAVPHVVRELASAIDQQRTVVTDVASVKVEVMEAAREAGLALIGGHPMCGSERSGIDAADAELFAGARWVLTEHHLDLEQLIQALGAKPLVIDALRHDAAVAYVSHAAFVLSSAYTLACARAEEWALGMKLAGPGFRDMTRLAVGQPSLYADIARANRANLVAALDTVTASLVELRDQIVANHGGLERSFAEAKRMREDWSV